MCVRSARIVDFSQCCSRDDIAVSHALLVLQEVSYILEGLEKQSRENSNDLRLR